MAKVRVHRANELHAEFEFSEADGTLLNALQNNKVDALYHCKEGFCGACRCKLTSGEVDYINEPLAFVRKDEALTCCSKPSSDITIEIL